MAWLLRLLLFGGAVGGCGEPGCPDCETEWGKTH